MIKNSLWPTDVYQLSISKDDCDYLNAAIASYTAQGIPPEDMNKDNAFDIISKSISQLGRITITDVWIRTAANAVNNNFEIHCDSHKGTDYIGVLWLTGQENHGGDVTLYDPAWRNPQRLRHERQQTYNLKHEFKFTLGEFILFPSNVWHEVSTYTGTVERISLNFAINIDGINN